ncbi:hypothetical protein BT96DRAFT_932692 [Gymnopus androsaceus JB14]|uniref:DUF6533 domain-containing protein n=1 Tax=Gymnopus androsaceus JB14 TaxID=1447944 RepID=A0A6A4IER7_9AGAR|nr:hypothetical protein BT96DRAFT_932692 [Gymnopus androsaceus JB14]
MATLITELDSLVRVKYFSGVALVLVLYDHLLTLDDEFSAIWTKPHRYYLQKLTFVLNRYFAEAVVLYVAYGGEMFKRLTGFNGSAHLDDAGCRRFIWVFALAASVFIGITQLIKLQRICAILDLPSTFPYVFGALLGFDVFLIVLAVFNAFERPHRTNTDILDSLHSDGAKLFLVAALTMSIVGTPADTFGVLSMVWALNSVITSRIHLRVEGLKFAIFGMPGASFLLIHGKETNQGETNVEDSKGRPLALRLPW